VTRVPTEGKARSFTLVVNPAAGKGRGHHVAGIVERRLRAAGAEVGVLAAQGPEQALDWAHAAVERATEAAQADRAEPSPEHCLVAVGGDGTVHLALQAVQETGMPLGLVPAGSGDDAARAWGVPREPHQATEVLLGAPAVPVDLGRAEAGDGTVRWFATVVAAGFDAKVSERALRLPQLPSGVRYLAALGAELRALQPIEYRLALDGEAHQVQAMLVAIGNGASYGGGMLVCSGADPVDGLLDVLVLHPLPTAEFVRVFPKVYRGAHLTHRAVQMHRAAEVVVDAPNVVAFVDGEPLGPLPQRLSVRPGALRVLTSAVPRPRMRV
jgi:diacylglycerol kinase (ATP)